MENFTDLAANLPAPIITEPQESSSDLTELDNLLSESLALTPKTINHRIYKETKVKVDKLIARQISVPWDITENITVWSMTKCACGSLGSIVFVRYMQKLVHTSNKNEKHWETVKTLKNASDIPVRNALITREVAKCEYCQEVDYLKLENFNEVVK